MNEKTLNLLEFGAVRSEVAAGALSEEAGRIILDEEPLKDRDEVNKLKSLVSSLMDRLIFSGGESREGLPEIGHLFSKLELEGTVLDIDEAYALGLFIERAEAFKQWLLKPFRLIAEQVQAEDDSLVNAARELPLCAEISGEIFRILDHGGKLRDLPEFREIQKRIRSLQKDIESIGSR